MMKQWEVAILGKVTAGLTHELKNVLATINESTGLIQDILSESDEHIQHTDQLKRALGSIQHQIDRGADITNEFNTFAHCMDKETSLMTANGTIELVVFMMHRFARISQIELLLEPLRKDAGFTVNPIRLLTVLCTCVDFFLTKYVGAKEIVLRSDHKREEVLFEIVIRDCPKSIKDDGSFSSELPNLDNALEFLHAEIDSISSPDQVGLRLSLPGK